MKLFGPSPTRLKRSHSFQVLFKSILAKGNRNLGRLKNILPFPVDGDAVFRRCI